MCNFKWLGFIKFLPQTEHVCGFLWSLFIWSFISLSVEKLFSQYEHENNSTLFVSSETLEFPWIFAKCAVNPDLVPLA